MLNYQNTAATSSVLKLRTGEAVVARRTVPPVRKLDGTGLPFVAVTTDPRSTALGVGAGSVMADQFQGIGVVGDATVPGIPPRWRPVRC